jgi:hypothetical protein
MKARRRSNVRLARRSAVDHCESFSEFFARSAVFGLEREQCPKESELYFTAATPRQYPR